MWIIWHYDMFICYAFNEQYDAQYMEIILCIKNWDLWFIVFCLLYILNENWHFIYLLKNFHIMCIIISFWLRFNCDVLITFEGCKFHLIHIDHYHWNMFWIAFNIKKMYYEISKLEFCRHINMRIPRMNISKLLRPPHRFFCLEWPELSRTTKNNCTKRLDPSLKHRH